MEIKMASTGSIAKAMNLLFESNRNNKRQGEGKVLLISKEIKNDLLNLIFANVLWVGGCCGRQWKTK